MMFILCDHNPKELSVEAVVMNAGLGDDEDNEHGCYNPVSTEFHLGCHSCLLTL